MRNSPAPPYADPALYEQLLAGSLQGVLIVHGGRVALANLSAAELFGYASAEALTGEP
ncbi:MAG: PAS domain-containing protein, partial [Gammaproteobacteria bacterium]|nr:PAS domain-containing protein [Gammaproteobacteria bacterium]NIR96867.1 PAS domain-containing protein [Gammaproteobacteria bacterium]NIT62574.1 PAS domain-containing protein [Gammaproteobacteria bacterium]NIV19518.1 PAS domain-containing protein [Gammaproteobacteria bacterium]NIY31154.1 PAS domain-containing protein [Gammaproteobacteria bacterium]